MTTTLSHRERVRLALEHQETDRVPIAMVCSGINQPAHGELQEYLQSERGLSVEEFLSPLLDIKNIGPAYLGPKRPEGTDMWGVHRSPVSYGLGSYMEIDHYPLAGARDAGDILAHEWPSPDWFNYDAIPEQVAALQKDGDYCLMTANGNIFECSWYMRGFERMFVDILENPELVHTLFGQVTDFYVEHFRRTLSAADGEIDLVFTADDVGCQKGLLMSLDLWEENLKPFHVRLNELIHEFGAKVIYHSDGAVMEIVSGLIDMGIDVLQALQFDADGMDPIMLKQDFGEVLCFEGGVSVQQTLPFGTPGEVRDEVSHLIDVLGKDGGYILGPAHAIQAGTPPENIVAMFDTAQAYRTA